MAAYLPPKADGTEGPSGGPDPSRPTNSTGSSEVPADLQRLLGSGVCFGRLLAEELNGPKPSLEPPLQQQDFPRWDHRSEWYRERLVNEIQGFTDRGVRLDGWGPLEEHETHRLGGHPPD